MREFTSTSNRIRKSLFLLLFCAGANLSMLPLSFAEETQADQPEEESFEETPYTEYGEFNDSEEEQEDARFFQYGRFFGVGAGLGYHGVTGNRGLLWQGGFPYFQFKLHAWINFNFSVELEFHSAAHNYIENADRVTANMLHFGVNAKYYLDTSDMSSVVTFANPFFLIGAGSFIKTETFETDQVSERDSKFGFTAGLGLEFTVKPKKVYFQLEGKANFVQFKDTQTTRFQEPTNSANIEDLTGTFYSVSGNILFTW